MAKHSDDYIEQEISKKINDRKTTKFILFLVAFFSLLIINKIKDPSHKSGNIVNPGRQKNECSDSPPMTSFSSTEKPYQESSSDIKEFAKKYMEKTGKNINELEQEFNSLTGEMKRREIHKTAGWWQSISYSNSTWGAKLLIAFVGSLIFTAIISLGFPHLLLYLFSEEATIYFWVWPISLLLLMITWISRKIIMARITSVLFSFLTSLLSVELLSRNYPLEIKGIGLFEFMSISLAITSMIIIIFEIILAELRNRDIMR